jgi:PIN domain nuclease of toxin-antitoxin system
LRLLLDTHVVLWAITLDPKMPRRAHELIGDASNDQIVSTVTIWEVAIKHARSSGRPNDIPWSGTRLLSRLNAIDANILPILPTHAAAMDDLPPLHGDPFDRLLIAQARTESMHLLTHDKTLAAYGDFVIVV